MSNAGLEFVVNPKTNRVIRVGGRAYKASQHESSQNTDMSLVHFQEPAKRTPKPNKKRLARVPTPFTHNRPSNNVLDNQGEHGMSTEAHVLSPHADTTPNSLRTPSPAPRRALPPSPIRLPRHTEEDTAKRDRTNRPHDDLRQGHDLIPHRTPSKLQPRKLSFENMSDVNEEKEAEESNNNTVHYLPQATHFDTALEEEIDQMLATHGPQLKEAYDNPKVDFIEYLSKVL